MPQPSSPVTTTSSPAPARSTPTGRRAVVRRPAARLASGGLVRRRSPPSSGSVAARTSSTLTPGAVSRRTRPSGSTSMTARSVMIRWMQRSPVSGSEHSRTILWPPPLATCSIITMVRLAPWTRSIAPPMPLTILPGIIQLARSPLSRDLHRAEDRDVDVAAADHRERRRRVEVRRPRQDRHGLLAGVDEVGVDRVLGRVGADAEHAVLGVQDDVDAVRDVVGHQGRQADAEVDVLAVGELGGDARRQLVAGEASGCSASPSPARGGTGPLLDALLGARARARRAARRSPGCGRAPGRARPARRSSSTSAIVIRPAAAQSGLKFCARSSRRRGCRGGRRSGRAPARSRRRWRAPGRTGAVELAHLLRLGGQRDAALRRRSAAAARRSATCVPTPAGVKNAGMPAPPARSRSASVPCGTSSTSSSPPRNCRSNSLFSPT